MLGHLSQPTSSSILCSVRHGYEGGGGGEGVGGLQKQEEAEQMLPPKKSGSIEIVLTEDTTCGIGCLKGEWLQRFANKKAYVFLYGLLGCIFSASYAYFNGTITTLEKRFKIPSKTTGIITVGNDISTLFVSCFLSYYAGKGHRPRWIAVGIYTVVLFCLMNALPHFLYGPGEDALALTYEYNPDFNTTIRTGKNKKICQDIGVECDNSEGNISAQIILFMAQLVAGVGGSLYYTLGVSYMDDNIKRSKTPALISSRNIKKPWQKLPPFGSLDLTVKYEIYFFWMVHYIFGIIGFSYFIRMLGPAMGYSLASFCLNLFISPTLTPRIGNDSPRWVGAWWLGWLVLAAVMFIIASLLGLFPKTLPRAAARKYLSVQSKEEDPQSNMPASFSDMLATFKRLSTNATLMCNNFAAIFYFMGYMPYWIFMPKYIETMYKTSSSSSNIITGTVGLVFSALGILISGLVITRYKPRARPLALWNVVVGVISCLGITSYAFLGCNTDDTHGFSMINGHLDPINDCNRGCHCDFVKYSPVCSNGETFISPCHAGCRGYEERNGAKIYTDCRCVEEGSYNFNGTFFSDNPSPIFATAGPCPVDCKFPFYMFLAVVCILKFSGATGRASNFLVSVRCVEEKDKPVAMGFGLMLMSLFAFIPSPIFFGYIIDTTCLVWGKTCSGTGNCWLYNGESLRYIMNFISASMVLVGTLFDVGVWYYVKDLAIFDEHEEELKPVKNGDMKMENGQDKNSEKK